MDFDVELFLSALTSAGYFKGALFAIGLAALAQALGVTFGFLVAVMRTSGNPVLTPFAVGFTWIFRAVPVLLLLIICWNVLPQLVPEMRATWYTPFIAALIALTVHETALMAEIVRSGLLAVDPGQRQASRALGLSPFSAYRWVILPQVTRTIIPEVGNRLILQVQVTSLTSVISLEELMTAAGADVSRHFRYAEFYGAAAVYYLAIVSIFMVGQKYLERRFEWKSTHRTGPSRIRTEAAGVK